MSKSKETTISRQILDYLVDQNRPYSAIDIFNNLHKEHGKTAVLRALDQLVCDQKIKEKTYGKQKVYFADQSEFPGSNEADLQKLDSEINTLSQTLNEIQKRIISAEAALGTIGKSLTTEAAEVELGTLKNKIPTLKSKLNTLESNSVNITPDEKEAIFEAKAKYLKEYQGRKRMANDMISAIMEGYPKSKKQLFEELGIETDADLGLEKL